MKLSAKERHARKREYEDEDQHKTQETGDGAETENFKQASTGRQRHNTPLCDVE